MFSFHFLGIRACEPVLLSIVYSYSLHCASFVLFLSQFPFRFDENFAKYVMMITTAATTITNDNPNKTQCRRWLMKSTQNSIMSQQTSIYFHLLFVIWFSRSLVCLVWCAAVQRNTSRVHLRCAAPERKREREKVFIFFLLLIMSVCYGVHCLMWKQANARRMRTQMT